MKTEKFNEKELFYKRLFNGRVNNNELEVIVNKYPEFLPILRTRSTGLHSDEFRSVYLQEGKNIRIKNNRFYYKNYKFNLKNKNELDLVIESFFYRYDNSFSNMIEALKNNGFSLKDTIREFYEVVGNITTFGGYVSKICEVYDALDEDSLSDVVELIYNLFSPFVENFIYSITENYGPDKITTKIIRKAVEYWDSYSNVPMLIEQFVKDDNEKREFYQIIRNKFLENPRKYSRVFHNKNYFNQTKLEELDLIKNKICLDHELTGEEKKKIIKNKEPGEIIKIAFEYMIDFYDVIPKKARKEVLTYEYLKIFYHPFDVTEEMIDRAIEGNDLEFLDKYFKQYLYFKINKKDTNRFKRRRKRK